MKKKSYEDGYNVAKSRIAKKEDAQDLYNQSLRDLTPDEFTRSWQDACVEAGAQRK